MSSLPQLILMTGYTGSGKSTIGKRVCKQLGCAYLDKDVMTRGFCDKLLEVHPDSEPGNRDASPISHDIMILEYAAMLGVAKDCLQAGCSVMITSPFTSFLADESEWQKVLNMFAGIDYDMRVIWIVHSLEREHERIIERGAPRDQAKFDNWGQYEHDMSNALQQPIDAIGAYCLDNYIGADADKLAAEVVEWLESDTNNR